MNSPGWMDRLRKELQELTEKLTKLEEFLKTDACESMEFQQRMMLHQQRYAMKSYSGILRRHLQWAEEKLKGMGQCP